MMRTRSVGPAILTLGDWRYLRYELDRSDDFGFYGSGDMGNMRTRAMGPTILTIETFKSDDWR